MNKSENPNDEWITVGIGVFILIGVYAVWYIIPVPNIIRMLAIYWLPEAILFGIFCICYGIYKFVKAKRQKLPQSN
jgi:hypothetical protein